MSVAERWPVDAFDLWPTRTARCSTIRRTCTFDREVTRHLAFSVGSHRCLGSHLARHELAVALSEWHAAIPSYRVVPDAKITYTGGVFAMRNLPLEWNV